MFSANRIGGTLPMIAVTTALLLSTSAGAGADPAQDAKQILNATGVEGGLIVHLGCADGNLTAALRANESYIVHGLDGDAKNIERARAHIGSLGLYGKVSVEQWTSETLPYAENLINLLVAEDPGTVPMDEVMRVLVPNGVAYVKESGRWSRTVKPRPGDIDEWTHYLHDSTGNAVADDAVVGPPRHLQWVGSPRWARHHDRMASMSALVSAAGRIFYVFDEGSTASIQLPAKWTLTARDAFNGTILWKRPIGKWHNHLWPFKSGPAQLPRRLVAVGDVVYVTLALDAPLTALDAATGETLRTYDNSKATEEVIASDGVLYLLVNETPIDYDEYKPIHRSIGKAKSRVAEEWAWDEKPRTILALRADDGKTLWTRQQRVVPLTLTVKDQRAFFHDGEKVVCLNRDDGQELWSSSPVERRSSISTAFAPTLVAYRDVVLFSGGTRSMTALSAETGKTLWTADHARSGHNSPEDLLVINGLAWSGATAGGKDSGVFTGRDIHTGRVVSEFPPDVDIYWFHQRCYRSKATQRYLLPSRTGIEFVDVQSKTWMTHHWVRGGCIYGIMPCNGLVYAPPHDCACYVEAKLFGFNALRPAAPSRRQPETIPDEGRLQQGPAYGKIETPRAYTGASSDWPTFRHDPARSGFTKSTVPIELKQLWKTDLGPALSSVVIGENRVLVASVDTHSVIALDAHSGKTAWRFTAGGRIDSPPTVYQGRVLFGSADGYVYCLRATDGELAWRFRAAPIDQRLMAFEQLESVWPVHGSVLASDDVVTFVAGRSMFLDGGLRFCRLDARTGRKLSEKILDDRDPETQNNLQVRVSGLNMPAALPDVLSSDGRHIFMRSQRFDSDGSRQEIGPNDVAGQAGEGAHLFCPTGFLDGSWWHRSYWIYGKATASGAGGWFRAGKFAPAGRILVFDDTSVYGYGRKPEYYKWSTPLDYHLFSTSKEIPQSNQLARRRGGSRIKIAKSASLNPANSPLTVEAWVKAEHKDGVVVARGGASHGYALLVRGGKPRFAVRVDNNLSSVGGKENVAGKWVHLAGVLTADKMLQIYVDGKPAGSVKAKGLITSDPAQAMEIGADDGSSVGTYKSPFAFTGLIDEVRVYHRALGADEIRKRYESPGQDETDDTALVVYHSFDEGNAADGSGNKNDGTVVGAQPAEGRVGKAMRFFGNTKPKDSTALRYHWSKGIDLHVRAMVLADRTLFIAGGPDIVNEEESFDRFGEAEIQARLEEQAEALEGRRGASLWALSATDGKKLTEYKLETLPVFDGLAAAGGRLYIAQTDGSVLCMGK